MFTTDHFRVSLPGIEIGMFCECHGLSMEFDVFEWCEGGNNEFIHHLPGRLRYPPLTLIRGLTDQTALQDWLWKTRDQAELKDVVIEMQTQNGRTTRAWTFAQAFPVEWSGPAVASHGTGAAQETLKIVHAGLKIG